MKIRKNNVDKPLSRKTKMSSVITLLMLSAVQTAYASENQSTQKQENDLWQISLGAGAYVAPKYEGAKNYGASPLIVADITFMDHFFLSTTNGAGVHIINHPNWNLGLIANYVPGRKEKDSEYLKGLGDIDSYADVGVFAAWRPGPFSVSLQAMRGTNRVGGTHRCDWPSYDVF